MRHGAKMGAVPPTTYVLAVDVSSVMKIRPPKALRLIVMHGSAVVRNGANQGLNPTTGVCQSKCEISHLSYLQAYIEMVKRSLTSQSTPTAWPRVI